MGTVTGLAPPNVKTYAAGYFTSYEMTRSGLAAHSVIGGDPVSGGGIALVVNS